MAGRSKPSAKQRRELGESLTWQESMRLYCETNPGRPLHALATKYHVGLKEVEEALEADPDMDVVLTEFGKKAVPVMLNPKRYSSTMRKRAKTVLSRTMSILMDEERLKASSTNALSGLVPILVRMISGDLVIDPDEAPGAKMWTKEELVVTLKKSITRLRSFNPTIGKETEAALEAFEKGGDGRVLEAVFKERGGLDGNSDSGGAGGEREDGEEARKAGGGAGDGSVAGKGGA